MRASCILIGTALVLGGCSSQSVHKKQASHEMNAYDVSEPSGAALMPAQPGEPPVANPKPIEVSLPRLAYAYLLAFRLPDARIAEAQEGHRLLCEQMGAARCQLLALRRGIGEGQEIDTSLKLRVASSEARRFADRATAAVSAAGGRAIATSVVAEDVSKDMVDTEARIRQRQMLVARLTEILRNRAGKVAELSEAERSVAQAQEELDQAQGWLAELRGRVAMSDIDIRYSAVAPAVTPRETRWQIGDAIASSAAFFALALKGLLMLLIFLLPWTVVLGPIAWLAHASAKRARRRAEAWDAAEEALEGM
jgi:hypothetical protein